MKNIFFVSKEKDKLSMLKSLQSEWTWKQFVEGCMSKCQMFIKYSNMSLTTKHRITMKPVKEHKNRMRINIPNSIILHEESTKKTICASERLAG